MTTETYSGSTIEVADELPGSNDKAGFEAVSWVSGQCALQEVPAILREWDKVTEELVCGDGASYDKKGGYKWNAVTYKLTRHPGDAAQDIYESLEDSKDVGSFKLALPGTAGTIYFTAQVSKFSMADGGTKNTIHSASVELLIQSKPVLVTAS